MKLLKVIANGFKNCADDFEISFVPIAKKTAEDKEYELEEIAEGLFVFSTVGVVGKNASGKTTVLDLLNVCYEIFGKYRIEKKTFSLDNVSLKIYFYYNDHIFRYSTKLRERVRGGGIFLRIRNCCKRNTSKAMQIDFLNLQAVRNTVRKENCRKTHRLFSLSSKK